jgi:hypothetical protein
LLRALWLTPFNIAIRNLFTASFSLKAVILLLEVRDKRAYFNDCDKSRSPEETSGLYSQSVFWWLNSILVQGFRQVLKPDDLYRIDDDMSAELLSTGFWKVWNECKLIYTPYAVSIDTITYLTLHSPPHVPDIFFPSQYSLADPAHLFATEGYSF